jgi:hypothetical protein
MRDLERDLAQILKYIKEEESNPDLPYFACEALPFWLAEVKRLREALEKIESLLEYHDCKYSDHQDKACDAYALAQKALKGE